MHNVEERVVQATVRSEIREDLYKMEPKDPIQLNNQVEESLDVKRSNQTRRKKSGKRPALLSPKITKAEEKVEAITKVDDKVEADKKHELYNCMVVLKVKMHCPGCVAEVTRSLLSVEGVMEVNADAKSDRVTVKGRNMEAKRLCDRVMRKTGKRCEVVEVQVMEESKKEATKKKTNEATVQQQQEKTEEKVTQIAIKQVDYYYAYRSDLPAIPATLPATQASSAAATDDDAAIYKRALATTDYADDEYVEDEDVFAQPQEIFSDENPNACCIV